MDDRHYSVRVPKRWVRVAMIVGVTALVVAPLAAVATHSFNDVPNDNTFHADIAWLKEADVTRGCNPPTNNLYCPKDNVTREQMAAFMKRLAENQVVDAGTLQGKVASDLQNSVFFSSNPGFPGLPGGATTEVHTLTLPPGTYLVTGTGTLNNNAATAQGARCTLSAGTESVTTSASNYVLGPNTEPASREDWTLHLVATLASPSDASISCTTSAGWSGNIIRPQLVALAVDAVTVADVGVASTGSEDG